MKKCKYCKGTGTKPIKPKVESCFGITEKQPKTVERCTKCYGKGWRAK